jgi:hypothetical protein
MSFAQATIWVPAIAGVHDLRNNYITRPRPPETDHVPIEEAEATESDLPLTRSASARSVSAPEHADIARLETYLTGLASTPSPGVSDFDPTARTSAEDSDNPASLFSQPIAGGRPGSVGRCRRKPEGGNRGYAWPSVARLAETGWP